MPTTYEQDLVRTNETYIKNWDELKRFLTYELLQDTGEARFAMRKAYDKMVEIQRRAHENAKRVVYRLFITDGEDRLVYLVDASGHRTEAMALAELTDDMFRGAFPESEAVDHLVAFSPYEWQYLIDAKELDFAAREDVGGKDYGFISSLVPRHG